MNETILQKDGHIILDAINLAKSKLDGSKVVIRKQGINDIQVYSVKQIKNITDNIIQVLELRDANKTSYSVLGNDYQIVLINNN